MRLFRIAGLVFLLAACACAQLATTTSLVGTVTDSSGKVIQSAKVTAVETGTADNYTRDHQRPRLLLARVRPRRHLQHHRRAARLSETSPRPASWSDINQTVRTDFTLPVGAVYAIGHGRGAVTAIKTDDATVSEIMSTRSIAELAAERPRPMQLARMTPGRAPGHEVFRNRHAARRGFQRRRNARNSEQHVARRHQHHEQPDHHHAHAAHGGIGPGSGGPDRHLLGAVRRLHGRAHQHGHEVRHQPVPWRAGGVLPQPGSGRPQLLHAADARQPDGRQAAAAPEPVRLRIRWPGDHSETLQRQGQDVLHGLVRRLPAGAAGDVAFHRNAGRRSSPAISPACPLRASPAA